MERKAADIFVIASTEGQKRRITFSVNLVTEEKRKKKFKWVNIKQNYKNKCAIEHYRFKVI